MRIIVMLRREWNGANAWTTRITTGIARPPAGSIGVLWAAEVRARNPDEAKAVAMEWLAKGRPTSMDVEEVYSDFVGEHMRPGDEGG
jgi:translation elongation factor EF-Ts